MCCACPKPIARCSTQALVREITYSVENDCERKRQPALPALDTGPIRVSLVDLRPRLMHLQLDVRLASLLVSQNGYSIWKSEKLTFRRPRRRPALRDARGCGRYQAPGSRRLPPLLQRSGRR